MPGSNKIALAFAMTATVTLGIGALGGCGNASDKPPPAPTTEQLSRIEADTTAPAYWLGRRYRGLAVTEVTDNRYGVSFSYGEWFCDPGSGCTANGRIATRKRTPGLIDFSPTNGYRACWSRVGGAVAVLDGCDRRGYPHFIELFTGESMIAVGSLYTANDADEISGFTVARDLKPLNRHSSWPLPKPTPLSCREYRRFAYEYRKTMPRALRPTSSCRFVTVTRKREPASHRAREDSGL